jgi:hypothetical protein
MGSGGPRGFQRKPGRDPLGVRNLHSSDREDDLDGRVAQVTGKYGEHPPMATVCCNACRACATTNIVGIAMAGVSGAGVAVTRLARRLVSAHSLVVVWIPSAAVRV